VLLFINSLLIFSGIYACFKGILTGSHACFVVLQVIHDKMILSASTSKFDYFVMFISYNLLKPFCKDSLMFPVIIFTSAIKSQA